MGLILRGLIATQIARASRLDRIVDGLESIEGVLAFLQALANSEKVSHPETWRDEWLAERLDRAFSRKPERADLPLIMEVACSKGLHYVARVYECPLCIQRPPAENVL